jgi:hypothetical protein
MEKIERNNIVSEYGRISIISNRIQSVGTKGRSKKGCIRRRESSQSNYLTNYHEASTATDVACLRRIVRMIYRTCCGRDTWLEIGNGECCEAAILIENALGR